MTNEKSETYTTITLDNYDIGGNIPIIYFTVCKQMLKHVFVCV